MIASDSSAAEREADEDVGPVLGEVLATVQLLLDAAGGEEEDLVRRHRGAEQGDGVVGVGGRPRRAGRRR